MTDQILCVRNEGRDGKGKTKKKIRNQNSSSQRSSNTFFFLFIFLVLLYSILVVFVGELYLLQRIQHHISTVSMRTTERHLPLCMMSKWRKICFNNFIFNTTNIQTEIAARKGWKRFSFFFWINKRWWRCVGGTKHTFKRAQKTNPFMFYGNLCVGALNFIHFSYFISFFSLYCCTFTVVYAKHLECNDRCPEFLTILLNENARLNLLSISIHFFMEILFFSTLKI